MEITLIVSVVRKCPQMERIPEHLGASKETWICKNTFASPDDDNRSLSCFLSQVCRVSVRTDGITYSRPVEPSAADKPAEDICMNVILDFMEGGQVPFKVIQSWADKHSFSNICIPLATNPELNSLSTNNSILRDLPRLFFSWVLTQRTENKGQEKSSYTN